MHEVDTSSLQERHTSTTHFGNHSCISSGCTTCWHLLLALSRKEGKQSIVVVVLVEVDVVVMVVVLVEVVVVVVVVVVVEVVVVVVVLVVVGVVVVVVAIFVE